MHDSKANNTKKPSPFTRRSDDTVMERKKPAVNNNKLAIMPQCAISDFGAVCDSILVQVMVWCRQATSHYLSQCWLLSRGTSLLRMMTWKIFPHRRPFMRGLHWLPVDHSPRGPVMRVWCFFFFRQNNLLNKQTICRWFETPWLSRDVIVMILHGEPHWKHNRLLAITFAINITN